MNEIAPTRSVSKPQLKQGGTLTAIVPMDAEQAFRMAELIMKAGWAPKDMNRPEAITVAIMKGLEVGMKPMQSVQSIAIINGRPCIWGDAAIGLVSGSGLLTGKREWIECEGDQMVARCELHRLGWDMPITATFSVEDAKSAKLWGKAGPWQQYPKRMLGIRARAFALRDGFADVLTGLQIREEVTDYHTTEAIDATPSSAVSKDDILQQAGIETPAEIIDVEDSQEPDAEPVKATQKVSDILKDLLGAIELATDLDALMDIQNSDDATKLKAAKPDVYEKHLSPAFVSKFAEFNGTSQAAE